MADQVRVFVSHHHSNEEDAFTARLVTDLEAAGADVWVDDQRITSNNFVQKISEGLEGRQWLVLVMTPQSVASPWVRNEVNTALNEQTAGRMLGVIPIVMTYTSEQDIPLLWRPLHRYDATSAYEPARDGLLHALGLNAPMAPAASQFSAQPPILSPAAKVATAGLLYAFGVTNPRFPLPDVQARLDSLGFRGINVNGTPAIIPPLIAVPAGSFLMGSDKTEDSQANDDELPRHRVGLYAFNIGKYPVTVAEYALAVRAGAVQPPGPHDARSTGAHGGMTRAYFLRFVGDSGGVDLPWDEQQSDPDHPVVSVSWLEAMAYAEWLSMLTGLRWRLPSEAEWEKAARWDARNRVSQRYPWGDEFDGGRCNTVEYNRTFDTMRPVGSYTADTFPDYSGASPYGAEDMAGNVWEWTSSLYMPYPYVPTDGREDQTSAEARTLRGGSWCDDAQEARAARRLCAERHESQLDWGFRLALSPSAGL